MVADQRKERVSPSRTKQDFPASSHRDLCTGDNYDRQCKEERNFLAGQSRQGRDDEVPMNREALNDPGEPKSTFFRNGRNDPVGDAMLQQVQNLETPTFDPPPGFSWIWNEDQFILLREKVCTNVCVIPIHTGVFEVNVGGNAIAVIPTLRQAMSIADSLSWVFRDSLPVKNQYVNLDVSTPKPERKEDSELTR